MIEVTQKIIRFNICKRDFKDKRAYRMVLHALDIPETIERVTIEVKNPNIDIKENPEKTPIKAHVKNGCICKK